MSDTYSLSLALIDFIPSLAFLVGAYYLMRIARMCGPQCTRLALLGSILIFWGGTFKAIWKLVFTLSGADVVLLRESQFVLHAPGFLTLLVAVIILARQWRVQPRVALRPGAPILLLATWKIPLLATMTLSSMGVNGIFAYLAFQHRERLAAAGFIAAFLCLVGMGAMSSGEQTITRQWIEEITNAFGQVAFALGCWRLYVRLSRDGGIGSAAGVAAG